MTVEWDEIDIFVEKIVGESCFLECFWNIIKKILNVLFKTIYFFR